MRHVVSALFVVLVTTVSMLAQGAAPAAGPTFDVVSVRMNAAPMVDSGLDERPDGGFTMTNSFVTTLIRRAYPAAGVPNDWVGLPDWATRERFDVAATSTRTNPTAEERAAMTRALLEERFRLVARIEPREQQVYELVRLRQDGPLGPGMKREAEDVDCEARTAALRAAADAAQAAGQPPPQPVVPARADLDVVPPVCTIVMSGRGGMQMAGRINVRDLASFLRGTAGRPVVDRTGLAGLYHVTLLYDRLAGSRGPATADTPGAPPSVFTAVQEQLGLRLEPSQLVTDVLVIDRLERPTAN